MTYVANVDNKLYIYIQQIELIIFLVIKHFKRINL